MSGMDLRAASPFSPQTIVSCPIRSCTWTSNFTQTPANPVTVAPTTDIYAILHAVLANHEAVIREHLETHTLLEWVQEVTRLREELEAAQRENERLHRVDRIREALQDAGIADL
jgi:hypothetical protein